MSRTTLPTTRHLAVGLALATTLLVSGCGSSDTSTTDSAPTAAPTTAASSTPATSATTSTAPAVGQADLDVTIDGDDVQPRGDRIDVDVDQPVTIHVTSDRAGELHVHSSPEQELAYGVGETDLTLTIKVPGVIDVEDHVSDTVVAQLEVS